MIKYIGQHIFDFIARFRNDVYLEDIADGTVASDKFLGLDSNNKIVKETVSAGITVSDSNADTHFPIVFHDESNNLHDDTGAFTYNPNAAALRAPGSVQVGTTIELGHASDTTLARSAAGKVTIEGNEIMTGANALVSSGPHILKQTKVTIDTAGFNGLNSTPVELVPAQGANTVIVPTEVVLFHDRAATNTVGTDLIVGFNGTTNYTLAVKYVRRYMQGATTDRTMQMLPYIGTFANDLTTAVNSNLTIALGGTPTTNCVTSLTVYTSYYVIDIS